jgi:hypothetical protein
LAHQKSQKAMSNYPHFRPGQKVRTKFGDIRTVRKQIGSQVFVEEPDINGWYDSGQLWLVRSEDTSTRLRAQSSRSRAPDGD